MVTLSNADELSRKTIYNARRSNDSTDFMTVMMGLDTTQQQLDTLHHRILEFVKKYPHKFRPSCLMFVSDLGASNMITIKISIDYKGTWQEGLKRIKSRSLFMMTVKDMLHEMGLKYSLPVQKIEMVENA
jgi:hypothetical protein